MSKYIFEKETETPSNRSFDIASVSRFGNTKNEPGKIEKHSYFVANRSGKFGLRLSIAFLIMYFILPPYFGIALPGFDLTIQRIGILAMLVYILAQKNRAANFWREISNFPALIFIFVFLAVLALTAVRRAHIGSVMYDTIEFIGLFLMLYIIKYELGLKKTIKTINLFGYVLGILGLIEYVMQRPLFLYLRTIKDMAAGVGIRAGTYRIMGPAVHSLGYGLMLIFMIAIACVEIKENRIDLFANPFLLVLLVTNAFLSGSRSALAVVGLELVILFVFEDRARKKKTILIGIILVAFLTLFVLATWGTSISNYIMRQITSVIDTVFGTSFSVRFGANLTELSNSSNYRRYLPRLFVSPWLSPLIGQGSGASFYWYVDGFKIQSLDNFYVAEYFRFAYPGLISYVVVLGTMLGLMISSAIKRKSGLYICLIVGVACYLLNLWWVDTLQTIKYLYIVFAIYWSCETMVRAGEQQKNGKEKISGN